MDRLSSRVRYRNLKETEIEMVSVQELDINAEINADVSRKSNALPLSFPEAKATSLKTLILACMVAAGVQFGWALQLSLLTPYVQVRFF